MKKVFLHIGYPKCMSTAIQRNFFEMHSEILYGGIGINDNISYDNNEIEDLFELSLKYSNNYYFNFKLPTYKKNIHEFIKKKSSSHKAIVFSNEALSMNFSLQGLDSDIKYIRIKEVFKHYDVNIILVTKPILDIIRGIYKEYIKMGFDLSYEYYLQMLIALKDRNFLSDLNIENKKKQLSNFFGEKNVHIINIGGINKEDQSKYFCKEAIKILGINNEITDFNFHNESLSNISLSKLLNYNKNNKIGMGKNCNEPFERHRSKKIFLDSKINFMNDFIFENVIDKRKALKEYQKMGFDEDFMNTSQSISLEKIVLEVLTSL